MDGCSVNKSSIQVAHIVNRHACKQHCKDIFQLRDTSWQCRYVKHYDSTCLWRWYFDKWEHMKAAIILPMNIDLGRVISSFNERQKKKKLTERRNEDAFIDLCFAEWFHTLLVRTLWPPNCQPQSHTAALSTCLSYSLLALPINLFTECGIIMSLVAVRHSSLFVIKRISWPKTSVLRIRLNTYLLTKDVGVTCLSQYLFTDQKWQSTLYWYIEESLLTSHHTYVHRC